MKKFLFKVSFYIYFFFLLFVVGIFLPATPRSSNTMVFSNLLKDSLMKNVKSPRIILIGGSNLSFGINSQLIKDSLNINPINAGIHAAVGLIYMMSNSLEYIKKDDIVILVPEYQQFYGDFAYGNVGEDIVRTIFDVNIHKIKHLNFKQFLYMIKMLPNYSFSKYNLNEYQEVIENNSYSVNAFNEYGDIYKHWDLKKVGFMPYKKIIDNHFNYKVLWQVKKFQTFVEKKDAMFFISYPGFQDSSYFNQKDNIKKVENELKKIGLNTIGNPERYMIPDSLMFDTGYHLTKEGVDYRTNLLILDIKRFLKNVK